MCLVKYTKYIRYYDFELGIELEFEDLIKLADWLGVSPHEVVAVLDYGKSVQGWTAVRIIDYKT